MGFLQSYRALTKQQKIMVGVVWIIIGAFGPYLLNGLNDTIRENIGNVPTKDDKMNQDKNTENSTS